MPRLPLHALVWSADHNLYKLYTQGHLEQRFQREDEEQWLTWLDEQTSFAFQGCSGRLNVYKEARPRGERYWYAYHLTGKRYLGRTANVTLARLEQETRELTSTQSPVPLAPSVEEREPHRASRQAEQRGALLATKLAHPRLPSALVVRERLLRDLDAAVEHRLTLLSASAGWGKTTLLSAWATRHPHQVAWVSLDELDNDLTRFWVAVIAALRTCLPAVGQVTLAMLHSPEPPPLSAMLTALLNELSSVVKPTAPILLILDDYHVIEDRAIHDALTFFLEHLPTHLHLVLASRVDPELPLSRWRVQGQMAEIRAAELRFTRTEATTFFTEAMGYGLTEADVRLLERRTDGWIAGLQLAALAMRQREDLSAFVQVFTGSHRYLVDYVQEEILQRQPLPVQRFLLQSAVLSRMNAAVCAALTEDPTSQELLEWLERNNLFVVPLDEERQWYRFHDLFREALLARLRATQPELVPRLHQRAAHWYAAHNELREAVTHALAAADFSYAADLMERAAEEVWLQSEIQTLYRWVMALPEAVVRTHARLVLTAALYLLNSSVPSSEAQRVRARTQAEQMMARVEAVLRQPEDVAALPETETALLHQRLHLLRGWCALSEARAEFDLDRLRSIWQQMQHLSIEDDVLWQMIPLYVMVLLRGLFLREAASLVPLLLEAKQRVTQSGNRFATLKVMQWLAMMYLITGQLRQAQKECVAALDLLQQIDGHTTLGGYFYDYLSWVFYFWNELDEARALLRQMIHDAQIWQQVDLQVVGYLQLAEVELAEGNLVEAQQALQEAQQLVQLHGFAIHQSWVEAVRAKWWLAEGNLAAAGDWAAQVVFHPDAWNPHRVREFAQLVWVYLVQGRYTQALETLERFSTHLDRPEDMSTTTRFLALRLMVGIGRPSQAFPPKERCGRLSTHTAQAFQTPNEGRGPTT